MTLLLALILGCLFGFVLQKTGAANPHRIIGMLRLRDFHLMKAILTAVAISSFLLYLLIHLGFIESSHISVKPAYTGVILGGAILGIGWALAGYCPGTGLVAAGAGRRDALFFIIGGLIGALIYMLGFGAIADSFLFNSLGGKMVLTQFGYDQSSGLPIEFHTLGITSFISGLLVVIAWMLPEPNA